MISGVLTIFISAAVRHRRIVSVTPELRALVATIVALVAGVLLEQSMHHPVTAALTKIGIPEGAHFYLAIVPLVIGSAAVHRGAHAIDHLFNRGFYAATHALDEAAKRSMQADEEDIDELLVQAPIDALNLASGPAHRQVCGPSVLPLPRRKM